MNGKSALFGALFGSSVLANVIFASVDGIAPHEGRVNGYYQDPSPAGHGTICFGNRSAAVPGFKFTDEECLLLLLSDVIPHVLSVRQLSKVELDPWAWVALTSFSFNLGINALKNSTLLVRWNAGDRAGAEVEINRWKLAGGVELPGLVFRRACEGGLLGSGVLPANCPWGIPS